MRTLLLLFSVSLLESLSAEENVSGILARQTQELFDAIATGAAPVWDKYVDERASFTDENGAVLSKKEMIETLRPFPKEITGRIKVTDFRVTSHGSVAIATHLDDEHETYYGHELHCQYRATDTWKKTTGGWRLIAVEVIALRTDPPPVRLPRRELQQYVGRYRLAAGKTYEIRWNSDGLEGQETGRQPELLEAEVADMFFVPGKPRYRKVFLRDSSGRITAFAERREAWDLVWNRAK
ncbi:MAG: DUF4440 domain-containing protein [Acidobacteriia bacterium]|nr:DUF4440 domain-containing protein [Terriglobia bacterium]MBV8902947.1 DUF4440 domain-containing protein [Terriglobia bacterium]MBV9743194.1 DUF4440 domain-containing protein [Terriglobia bacterium]